MTGLGTQSMTDLAIDKADHMVGITLDKLYSIDATTGTVTLIKDLSQSASNFTSLSYVPTDLDDPNSADILVSANSFGDVFKIDPTAGTATKLGSYGTLPGGRVGSSGDIDRRARTRHLRDGRYPIGSRDPNAPDYLAKIDPATWTGDADRHRHRLQQHLRPRLLGREVLRLRRRQDHAHRQDHHDRSEHRRGHRDPRRARRSGTARASTTDAPIIE